MFELMTATDQTKSKGILSGILLGSDDVAKSLSENLDVEGIRAYFSTLDEQAANSDLINNLEKMKLALQIPDRSSSLNGKTSYLGASIKLDLSPDTSEVELLAEDIEFLDSVFEQFDPTLVGTVETFGDLDRTIQDVNSRLGEGNDTAMALDAAVQELRPSLDYLEEGFDTLSQSIENHKQNILELQNAMSGLRQEVETTYTALGGREFDGKLEYELAVKMDETKLDRFQEFAEMAKSYGSEYLGEFTNQYDKYGNSMEEAITTIYDYNAAVEKQKKRSSNYKRF